jgi:hypothetical protein
MLSAGEPAKIGAAKNHHQSRTLPFGNVTVRVFSILVMRHAGCEPNRLIMADNWP